MVQTSGRLCSLRLCFLVCSQTNIGPIVVAVNPHTSVPGPWALSDVRRPRDADAAGGATPSETPLDHVVRSAVRAQLESGHSQAILLK